MGNVAKIQQLVCRKQIDENGVIVHEEENKVLRLPQEPPFIKVYLDNVLYLSDMPTGLSGILWCFLKRMSYASNGQKIYTNSSMKREILFELHSKKEDESDEMYEKRIKNMSLKNIDNAISTFVKGNILTRKDRGVYEVNSTLFGKGEWKDIQKIQLTVTYGFEGKTFKSEIEKVERIEKALEEMMKTEFK